jgi:hypothetical protein
MHEQLQALVSKGPKRIAHPRDHSKVNDERWLAQCSTARTLIEVLA